MHIHHLSSCSIRGRMKLLKNQFLVHVEIEAWYGIALPFFADLGGCIQQPGEHDLQQDRRRNVPIPTDPAPFSSDQSRQCRGCFPGHILRVPPTRRHRDPRRPRFCIPPSKSLFYQEGKACDLKSFLCAW